MKWISETFYKLSGVFGCLVAYIAIGISILLSPWFSWHKNALSDLGHSIKSQVAPIFNTGLLLAGFLIVIFVITIFHKHARYSSFFVIISAFTLQLIATFDEVYSIHFVVSVLFFISIGISSLVYAIEKRSLIGLFAFIINILSWILYEFNRYSVGIAVPETISSLVVALIIVSSYMKIYSEQKKV